MKVYWSRCGYRHGNFGDKLTPLLLRHYGIDCEWAPVEHAKLIGVGSVLEKAPADFEGIICSTGFMHETSHRDFRDATVLGVRGRLTLERILCQNRDDVVLGDAGLLCDAFPTASRKSFKLGIIPHFADADVRVVGQLAALGDQVTVIDVCDETLEVIRRVSECEHILSSSLHGLILADSLGIPNQWIELHRSGSRVEGAGFKFRDYYSIFNLEPQPIFVDEVPRLDELIASIPPFHRPGIDSIKERLRIMFSKLHARVPLPSHEQREATRRARAEWNELLETLQVTVARHVPRGTVVLLADEDQLRTELQGVRAIPFVERNGSYWGPPGTDEEAIAEIRRTISTGVEWFIIAWPMFWAVDHYCLARYLTENFETVEKNPSAIVLRIRR